MAISEGTWDGSASRFTDAQYEKSCVLDRSKCGGDAAKGSVKERCSLPIREPNGDLSRAGVHAAASRINQVKDACPAAISAAKSQLRTAYKTLGEDAPDSIRSRRMENGKFNPTNDPDLYREQALATFDHEWEFTRAKDDSDGYIGTLAGHFAVFNRWAEINSPVEGHFLERMLPGAFTKTFADNQRNMKVLFNHGKDPNIGLKVLGKIQKLEEDERGAYYEVGLHDTPYVRDLMPGLRDNQYGASFRFAVVRENFKQFPERSKYNPQGIPESSIAEVKVREFGPVTFGAYEEATSGLRSLNEEIGIDLWMLDNTKPHGVVSFASAARELDNSSANVGTGNGGSLQTLNGDGETVERNWLPTTGPVELGGETWTHACVDEGGQLLFARLKEGGVPEKVCRAVDPERDDPSSQDYSIAWRLKALKGDLAQIKALQIEDLSADDDEDDQDVEDCLDAIDDAIDAAIKAQAQDCAPDDGSGGDSSDSMYAQEPDPSDQEREESIKKVPDKISPPRTPADGAPDHSRAPFGSTLRKRAVPLITKRGEQEPVWKL
jgi:HK97 family phage prohead protease